MGVKRKTWITKDELDFIDGIGTWRKKKIGGNGKEKTRVEILIDYLEIIKRRDVFDKTCDKKVIVSYLEKCITKELRTL